MASVQIELTGSPRERHAVIPAEAGIQRLLNLDTGPRRCDVTRDGGRSGKGFPPVSFDCTRPLSDNVQFRSKNYHDTKRILRGPPIRAYDLEGLPHTVQVKVRAAPHGQSQALVTTIRQAGGFAAISPWLSASDTTGLWNNKDAHPGGVPLVISIERFSINANGRRCDPSGVRSFSPHAGGGATSLHHRLMACKP
jgi:hypothetical protein